MDLKQLTYFTWVYDAGSFTAAAEKARVVQPTLSMQIKRLETELGVKLFERTRGGVKPTRAGALLYQHSLAIIREMAVASDAFTEIKAGEAIAGKIIAGIPPVLSRGVIGATILEFLGRYPNVDVAIKEAYTGTVVDWVREGKVDFAFGAMPASGPGLMQRLIYRDTVFLLSGKPLNGDNYTPFDLSTFRGLKVILPSPKHSFGAFVRDCIEKGSIIADGMIEIDGYVGGMELPKVSDWVSLLPFVAIADGNLDGLYAYPVSNPKIPFDVYLVYDQRRPLSPAALRFIDIVTRHLREQAAKAPLARSGSTINPAATAVE